MRGLIDFDATPLKAAISRDLSEIIVEIIELILQSDVSLESGLTYSPLQQAAALGKIETIKYLVERGAPIDGKDRPPPLVSAAEFGQVDSVVTLLELGADINALDFRGETAMTIAIEKGHLDIVQVLLDAGTDEKLSTLLILAAKKGHAGIVTLLLESEADVESTDNLGNSALSYASSGRHFDVAVKLLSFGAGIAESDANTLLSNAVEENHVVLVNMLLKKKADANTKYGNGDTILLKAVTQGQIEVVRKLLEAGAYVNTPDKNGDTPLQWAITLGHEEIENELRKAGAKEQ